MRDKEYCNLRDSGIEDLILFQKSIPGGFPRELDLAITIAKDTEHPVLSRKTYPKELFIDIRLSLLKSYLQQMYLGKVDFWLNDIGEIVVERGLVRTIEDY